MCYHPRDDNKVEVLITREWPKEGTSQQCAFRGGDGKDIDLWILSTASCINKYFYQAGETGFGNLFGNG